MRFGLALPQYDYSVPGESPLRFETIEAHAAAAEAWGLDSVWLSDHLFLDLAKYGGPAIRFGAFEPVSTLAALARSVPRVRLGTLVLLEALRPAAVLAKSLATLDRVSGGRLDVGLGAGWYEPDYEAIGMAMPPPGERIDRLREALDVVGGLLGGGPHTFAGRFHQADHASVDPPALQVPRPPLFVGGKGDRVLRAVADLADGWNTCWVWTTDAYRERLGALERACDAAGRDPATVWRSLGLYALCGENEADLRRRFERLRDAGPPGVLDGMDLDQWRQGRLVGTPEQIREQVAGWQGLGVETIILGAGSVPFHVGALDDVELLAHALDAADPVPRG
ncbi:MAG: LLM class flavin-dependent oxidoreductase [Acidimicrobiia bacterium]|jgi:alkanesulfonate monooxygenase SsuD/methylene tetrahydromethanopterin reductase-like flavin-dependent oxidoreductase (luciferase family)